jgi:1,3-beta-glucanosyltransferase GAS1
MPAIYGPDMTPVLSGAFVYEWIQEANDYGIITYPDHTVQDGLNVSVGSPVPMQPEFNNLKSQWAAASPVGVSMAAYTPTNTDPACPAVTAGTWEIDANLALPDTPSSNTPTPPAKSSSVAGGTPSTVEILTLGSSAGSAAASGTASGSSSSGNILFV